MTETENTDTDDLQDLSFLGREFLTWLLFCADCGEALFSNDEGEFAITFGAQIRLACLAGAVSDANLRGRGAAHGIETSAAIGAGRTVISADLRFTRGDLEWRATVEAHTLDLKGVKIPALLTDDEDDRIPERMRLITDLDNMVAAALRAFVVLRISPEWTSEVIPNMARWCRQALSQDDDFDDEGLPEPHSVTAIEFVPAAAVPPVPGTFAALVQSPEVRKVIEAGITGDVMKTTAAVHNLLQPKEPPSLREVMAPCGKRACAFPDGRECDECELSRKSDPPAQ